MLTAVSKADGGHMKHIASILVALVLVGCAPQTFVYGPGDVIVPSEVVLVPSGISPGVTFGVRRTVHPDKYYEYQLLVRYVGDRWLAAPHRLSIQTDSGTLVLNDPSDSTKRKRLYGGRHCEERAFPISGDDLRLIATSNHLSIVGFDSVEIEDLQTFRSYVRD